MRIYVNAKEILPEELFREVRKYHSGMMYVPKGNRCEDRKKLVLILHGQGTSAGEIAVIAGLSVRRVHQIIQETNRKDNSNAD